MNVEAIVLDRPYLSICLEKFHPRMCEKLTLNVAVHHLVETIATVEIPVIVV